MEFLAALKVIADDMNLHEEVVVIVGVSLFSMIGSYSNLYSMYMNARISE